MDWEKELGEVLQETLHEFIDRDYVSHRDSYSSNLREQQKSFNNFVDMYGGEIIKPIKDFIREAISTAVKEAESDLRGEINNNFWNKIIPQVKQDILDDFCIFLEKEGLTVLVDKLHGNKKYGGVEFYKKKFIQQPK